MTSEELQRFLNKGSNLSLKVIVMHDEIKTHEFDPICSYHNYDYFDNQKEYYIDKKRDEKDYGAIICLRSGLIICIELQDRITKVEYSSRANKPFSQKMLQQKEEIEAILKDYIGIVKE